MCFLEATVDVNMLMGKCCLSYEADLNITVSEYTAQGPDRFYFREVCYIKNLRNVVPPLDFRHESTNTFVGAFV